MKVGDLIQFAHMSVLFPERPLALICDVSFRGSRKCYKVCFFDRIVVPYWIDEGEIEIMEER